MSLCVTLRNPQYHFGLLSWEIFELRSQVSPCIVQEAGQGRCSFIVWSFAFVCTLWKCNTCTRESAGKHFSLHLHFCMIMAHYVRILQQFKYLIEVQFWQQVCALMPGLSASPGVISSMPFTCDCPFIITPLTWCPQYKYTVFGLIWCHLHCPGLCLCLCSLSEDSALLSLLDFINNINLRIIQINYTENILIHDNCWTKIKLF